MAHDEYYGLINGPQTSFSSKAPFSIAYRSSKAFILITVCLALFTVRTARALIKIELT